MNELEKFGNIPIERSRNIDLDIIRQCVEVERKKGGNWGCCWSFWIVI
jgi:hypothetical protein